MRITPIAAAMFFALSATPALAQAGGSDTQAAAATLAPDTFVWNDGGGTGPVSVVVSIADQRAYVYRGATMVAASAVSTGMDGRETPVGSFTVLQKQPMHHSNLYDDAAMPWMERLTWDGVALHAGGNPGYPTSHGCVHLPIAFAKKLYGITRVGTAVTVTDESVVEGVRPQLGPGLLPPEVAAKAAAETADANRQQLASISN